MTEVVRFRVSPAFYKQLISAAKEDKRDLADYIRLRMEEVLLQRKLSNEKES